MIFQSSSDTDHWNHEKKQIYLVRTDYRSTAYSRTSYWGITEEPLTEPLTKIKLRTTRNCCAQATSKCERLYEVSASRVIAGTSSGTWKWRFDWNNLICLLKLTLKSVSECSAMKSGFSESSSVAWARRHKSISDRLNFAYTPVGLIGCWSYQQDTAWYSACERP